MTVGFVLGNGRSRLAVDLEELKTKGLIYGCNAIYREFMPHVLVATDRLIANRIQEEEIDKKVKFWTRRPIEGSAAHKIERPYYGNSSGPVAVSRACIDGATHIFLLGFDLGTSDSKFNNIYADTEFYKKSTDDPTYAGNWIYQLNDIAKAFPKVIFFRVTGEESAEVKFDRNNMETIAMAEFKLKINKL